jgi:hypothetical protein
MVAKRGREIELGGPHGRGKRRWVEGKEKGKEEITYCGLNFAQCHMDEYCRVSVPFFRREKNGLCPNQQSRSAIQLTKINVQCCYAFRLGPKFPCSLTCMKIVSYMKSMSLPN